MFYELLSNEVVAQRLNLDGYSTFSYQGALALAEYLSEDRLLEFDRIAIRREFAEYGSAIEAAEAHGATIEDDPYEEFDHEEHALEWLEDQTLVIPFDGGIIVQRFQKIKG